jgi:hypothetical protein
LGNWLLKHCVFILRIYFKTNCTVLYRCYDVSDFVVPRYGRFPLQCYFEVGSQFQCLSLYRKQVCWPCMFCSHTWEHWMNEKMQQNLMWSTIWKVVTSQMSSRSLPRILHEDLRFHPYKVTIT